MHNITPTKIIDFRIIGPDGKSEFISTYDGEIEVLRDGTSYIKSYLPYSGSIKKVVAVIGITSTVFIYQVSDYNES